MAGELHGAIECDEFHLRVRSSAMQDGFFQLWNESQKEPEIRSKANCGVAEVSRVEMNAKQRRLDTPPTTTRACCEIS